MTRKLAKRALSDQARTRAVELAKKAADRKVRSPEPLSPQRSNLPISQMEEFQRMVAFQQVSRGLGIENPYFRLHDGHAKAESRIDGQDCINFSSYDYLALNADPRPAAAASAAITQFGVSASASRMVAGERSVHRDLEQKIADHYNCEAAQVFVSGHGTNVSTISALVSDGDVVLYDAYAHNSITAGIEKSTASRHSFPHNDLTALERLLSAVRPSHRNILVTVEGLYSMDGDVPDLPKLLEMKDRYGFWLMVDEAHALGCVGATGKGSFERFDLDPGNVDIWMGTLSKTLSSTGGFIAGSADLINFLRYYADGFVFSVALPPALAASAKCALELMHAEPERAAKLQANAVYFMGKAASLGLDTGLGEGYGVMPVIVGDSLKAVKLSERLFERGVNVMPAIFPGVPMNSARLRFFLSSGHSKNQIDQALNLTAEELRRLNDEKFGEAFTAAALGMNSEKRNA